MWRRRVCEWAPRLPRQEMVPAAQHSKQANMQENSEAEWAARPAGRMWPNVMYVAAVKRRRIESRAANLPPISRVYSAISATTGKLLKDAKILLVDAKDRKVRKRTQNLHAQLCTPRFCMQLPVAVNVLCVSSARALVHALLTHTLLTHACACC